MGVGNRRAGCAGVGRIRTPVLFAALVATAGCYTYRPVASPHLEPGRFVVAELTERGSERLAGYLGRDVRQVRGRCLSVSDSALVVSVSSVELQGGVTLGWQGETVSLPRGLIARLEERRLARGRSAVVVGGSIVAVVAVGAGFSLLGGGSASAGGPPPGPR